MKPLADLTQNDVEHILEIIDRLNDIEVHLEVDGMKLHVRKFSEAFPAATGAVRPAVAPALVAPQPLPPMAEAQTVAIETQLSARAAACAASESGLLEVRAPTLGRFFRASSPSEPAYVEIGSKVRPEDTVCMIEVMKLFDSVSAGVGGTIVEILVENGAMVEYDAVLFRVRPE